MVFGQSVATLGSQSHHGSSRHWSQLPGRWDHHSPQCRTAGGGLTTAASLLFTAGIGACAALSQVVLAFGATILVLITLRGVGFAQSRLDEWLRRVSRQHGEMNDKELALDSQDEDT